LSRDKAQCKAHVQLLSDRDVLVSADYDDICEHTGDIDAQFDY